MTTISLRRVSPAHRSCTIRDVPFASPSGGVQTSAPLPTAPASKAPCNHPSLAREGALCGKPSRFSRTHVHGDWYRPSGPWDHEETVPEKWWIDFGGEG